MASGVNVADGVKDIYNEMKVVKTDADQKERMRLVEFHIQGSSIEVENIYREKDLEDKDIYKFFLGQLDAKKCRYILYDCHFETIEASRKEELVFVMWAPDTAPIKEKMNYAASKGALKKVLNGVKHELQLNDLADCGDRNAFAERMGRGIIKMEGHPVKT